MISVIIPVYNVEPYLRRCVDSVLQQTYTDLEVILVDDGSPDACGLICDEYAQKDSRVQVIHQENGGLSAARNAGLERATGAYIAFLDSDDYIDPTMYERLLSVLTANCADIAECGYRWVKPDVTYDRENTGTVDLYTNLEALDKLYFGDQLFGGLSIVVWNKLYRAEICKNLRFAEGLNNEDVDFTPRAFYSAGRIVKLNLNLHNFFFSPNSISRKPYNLKKTDILHVLRRVMLFYRQNNLERYYDVVENLYFNNLFHHYFECFRRRKQPSFSFAAKELKKEIFTRIPDMLKSPSISNWRCHLFRISPFLWYCLMFAGKKAKRTLSNI